MRSPDQHHLAQSADGSSAAVAGGQGQRQGWQRQPHDHHQHHHLPSHGNSTNSNNGHSSSSSVHALLRPIRRALAHWRMLPARTKQTVLLLGLLYFAVAIAVVIVGPERVFNILAQTAVGLSQNPYGALIILSVIVLTSIPPMIGYGTAITLCGLAFGSKAGKSPTHPHGYSVLHGWMLAALGCLLGASVAFASLRLVLRRWRDSSWMRNLRANEKWRAMEAAVETKGFPMVILIRLSPFPYVYSNLFFASLRSVSFVQFFMATLLITPKLFLHVYVGSLMYEMLDGKEREKMKWEVKVLNGCYIVGGMLLGVGTGWYIWRETSRILKEFEGVGPGGRGARGGDAEDGGGAGATRNGLLRGGAPNGSGSSTSVGTPVAERDRADLDLERGTERTAFLLGEDDDDEDEEAQRDDEDGSGPGFKRVDPAPAFEDRRGTQKRGRSADRLNRKSTNSDLFVSQTTKGGQAERYKSSSASSTTLLDRNTSRSNSTMDRSAGSRKSMAGAAHGGGASIQSASFQDGDEASVDGDRIAVGEDHMPDIEWDQDWGDEDPSILPSVLENAESTPGKTDGSGGGTLGGKTIVPETVSAKKEAVPSTSGMITKEFFVDCCKSYLDHYARATTGGSESVGDAGSLGPARYAHGWEWTEPRTCAYQTAGGQIGHLRRTIRILRRMQGDAHAPSAVKTLAHDEPLRLEQSSSAFELQQHETVSTAADHPAQPAHPVARVVNIEQSIIYSTTWRVPVFWFSPTWEDTGEPLLGGSEGRDAGGREGVDGNGADAVLWDVGVLLGDEQDEAGTQSRLGTIPRPGSSDRDLPASPLSLSSAATRGPTATHLASHDQTPNASQDDQRATFAPLSRGENPTMGRACYFLHPCETAAWIAVVLSSSAAADAEEGGKRSTETRAVSPRTYLETFMMLVASAVEMQGF